MTKKTLLETVEEANKQPVPDRRLTSADVEGRTRAYERAIGESPTHREDFTSLLSAAAQKQRQAG